MNSRNFLGFFAKFPEPGKVKTRLAKHIGAEKAASFYQRITEYVLKRTAPLDFSYLRIVFYTPDTEKQRFADWLPDEKLWVQTGSDVGERMQNALQEMFDNGAEKAIVVGTDIPGLNREIIVHAFEKLDNSDIVIGPARDGGYYLIGMKSPYPELFRNIAWGTTKVFKETILKIDKMGLSFSMAPKLFDVDRHEDFIKAESILKDIDAE